MTNLKAQLSVQIPSGPTFQSTRTIEVDKNETFNVSIPPNQDGDASAGIDRQPKPSEGPIKLLLIQSNIYPAGEEAGEIKLTLGETPIADKPLQEPLFLLGTEVIAALGEIAKISFVNTYKPTKLTEKEAAVQKETEAKAALDTAKAEEEAAKKNVEEAEGAEAKAGAEEAVKTATAKVTQAETALKASSDEVTKAIAAVEKEIVEHTAQLSILTGREAPADSPAPPAEG